MVPGVAVEPTRPIKDKGRSVSHPGFSIILIFIETRAPSTRRQFSTLVPVGCISPRFAFIHKITTKVSGYGGFGRTALGSCESQNHACANGRHAALHA